MLFPTTFALGGASCLLYGEVTYSTAFVNSGASPSYGTVIVTPVPTAACCHVNSLTSSLPTGITATVTYSIDSGSRFSRFTAR